MQVELARCIATAQQALAELAVFSAPPRPSSSDPRACAVLASISATGIPKIVDSRVPDAVNSKFHALAASYFQQACMGLTETSSHRDLSSLQSTALQLQATWTSLYEQQIIKAANMSCKPAATQKQPFANDVLLYAFDQSQTPTRRQREVLASITGMTVEQVRVWFQNRRSRTKKKAKELQSRPAMQLNDVLGRVRAVHNASKSTNKQLDMQGEDEDDNDSGYGSSNDRERTVMPLYCPWPVRREMTPLATSIPTPRSYPADYVPQPLSVEFHVDPPSWRRVPAACPPVYSSTVTVDELARSMARLTLRHRSQTPHANRVSSCNSASAANNAPAQSSKPTTKKKLAQRDPATGRKVAGGRRVPPAAPVSSLPAPVVTASASCMAAISPTTAASGAPSKTRKKAGPPRRRPAGKTLSRQASDGSITSVSSCSTDTSRSTSCSSDFSFGSAASDFSTSSVESSSMLPDYNCSQQLRLGPGHTPDSRPAQEQAQVPTYDLSSLPCDFSGLVGSSSDMSALFDHADMTQFMQDSELRPPQLNQAVPGLGTAVLHQQQTFDVGVANMDGYLDFSRSAYPNLEALLSDDFLCPQPMQSQDILSGPSIDFGWSHMSVLIPNPTS